MVVRLLEVSMALVLTGAIFIMAGPYIGVWTFYWLTHFFG